MTAVVSAPTEQGTPTEPGFVGRIPVRNLWLLMLYASDLYQNRGIGQMDVEASPDDLPDLVARLLADAVQQRLRRQLSRGYQSRDATLNRVRGRIDLLATARGRLLDRGLVACRFDELSFDTPRHRYVRAALVSVAGMLRQRDLAYRCRSLAELLGSQGVRADVPTRAQLSTDRYGRHDAHDRHMVDAARLAFDLLLPSEAAGQRSLPVPDREEGWVRRLFERAVGGFYRVVLSPESWQVRCSLPLAWQISGRSAGIDAILPSMRTDVVLDHAQAMRRIVIDTKFTSIVAPGWRRDETLRSGYLYQMYAYLRSQAGSGDLMAEGACGLMLHPAIGQDVDETVVIQGQALRFATVDLTAKPPDIRARLLRFVQPWSV